MVYLVQAESTDKRTDETTKKLFLVQTSNYSLVSQHLNNYPTGTINPETIKKIQEISGIHLEDREIVALEQASGTLVYRDDTDGLFS